MIFYGTAGSGDDRQGNNGAGAGNCSGSFVWRITGLLEKSGRFCLKPMTGHFIDILFP
jgi:hypothetical protein